MIISPSHTLEYKPNDIIITSSIGDVLLHHPKIHIRHLDYQAPPPKIWEVEPRYLTLALLRLHMAPAPRI